MRLFGIFLLITILSWSAVAFIHAWSELTTPQPNYFEIGECPLPCWRGVQPGVHDVDRFWAALDLVNGNGGQIGGYPSTLSDNQLYGFTLQFEPNDDLRIGDLLILYGRPTSARAFYSAVMIGQERGILTEVALYWMDGYIEVRAVGPGRAQTLSPQMPITAVMMRAPAEEPIMPLGSPHWAGFGTIAQYQQEGN